MLGEGVVEPDGTVQKQSTKPKTGAYLWNKPVPNGAPKYPGIEGMCRSVQNVLPCSYHPVLSLW